VRTVRLSVATSVGEQLGELVTLARLGLDVCKMHVVSCGPQVARADVQAMRAMPKLDEEADMLARASELSRAQSRVLSAHM
jgi:hypothetical protein